MLEVPCTHKGTDKKGLILANAGHECKARMQGMNAGHECKARMQAQMQGTNAKHECRARMQSTNAKQKLVALIGFPILW